MFIRPWIHPSGYPDCARADSKPGSQGVGMEDLEVKCGFSCTQWHNCCSNSSQNSPKTSFIIGLIMKNSLSIPIVLVFWKRNSDQESFTCSFVSIALKQQCISKPILRGLAFKAHLWISS